MDPNVIVNVITPVVPIKVKLKTNFNGYSFQEYDDLLAETKSDDTDTEFKAKCNKLLQAFYPDDLKYNVNATKFVLEVCEMWYSKKNSGALKLKISTELLLPFF